MSAGTAAQSALLAYMLLGSTDFAAGVQQTVGLSLGSPSQASFSEIGAGSGYTRQPAPFGSVGVATNRLALASNMTFGPFSSSARVSGLLVFNSNGSLLCYGTLATVATLTAGSVATFVNTGITILLS